MLLKTSLYFVLQHCVLITFSQGLQLVTFFLLKEGTVFCQAEVEKLKVKNLSDTHILKNL